MGAVRRRGRAGVLSMSRRGVSLTLVDWGAEVSQGLIVDAVFDELSCETLLSLWVSLRIVPNSAADCRNGVR